jgi:hypothetical protein
VLVGWCNGQSWSRGPWCLCKGQRLRKQDPVWIRHPPSPRSTRPSGLCSATQPKAAGHSRGPVQSQRPVRGARRPSLRADTPVGKGKLAEAWGGVGGGTGPPWPRHRAGYTFPAVAPPPGPSLHSHALLAVLAVVGVLGIHGGELRGARLPQKCPQHLPHVRKAELVSWGFGAGAMGCLVQKTADE